MKPTSSSHHIGVATFDLPEAAKAFQHHLAERIVPSMILDERNTQRFWFLAPRRSGVHVLVPPDLAETARLHLALWERNQSQSHRPIHCPHCGSSRIEFPQLGRNFILPTLMAHLAVALGLQKRRHYCQDCHETWAENPAPAILPNPPRPRSA